MFLSRRLLEPYYPEAKDLDRDLETASDSSKEDDQLFAWLCIDEDVWESLCAVFERRMGTRKGFGAWLLEADSLQYRLNPDQRRIGAFFILLELREFGGHTLWNRVKTAPHYEDVVKQVHIRVAKRFKKTVHDIMSVEEREISLCAMLLGESLDQLSAEGVEQLLKDAQYHSTGDFSEVKKSLRAMRSGSGGEGRIGIARYKGMLGKTIAKRFGLALVESAWGASKLASVGRIGSIAAKVLPFALRRAGLYLSLGFLLKDAYQLGGEATRVTNPAVIIIALYRSLGDTKV